MVGAQLCGSVPEMTKTRSIDRPTSFAAVRLIPGTSTMAIQPPLRVTSPSKAHAKTRPAGDPTTLVAHPRCRPAPGSIS